MKQVYPENHIIPYYVYFFDLSTRIVKEDDDTIFISNNSNRYLVLKFKARFDRDIWYNEIYKRSENMKKILSSNPYNAFTNIKSNFRFVKIAFELQASKEALKQLKALIESEEGKL